MTNAGVPWAIATSGRWESARPVLETLGLDLTTVPVVTRDQVRYAKPEPVWRDLRLPREAVPEHTRVASGGFGD